MGNGDFTTGSWVLLCLCLCHCPDPAVPLPSVGRVLPCFLATSPSPRSFPRDGSGARGSAFPVSSHCPPKKSKAKSGLQKMTQAKWGSRLGPWHGSNRLSQGLQPTVVLYLGPSSRQSLSTAFTPTSLTPPLGSLSFTTRRCTLPPGSLAWPVPIFLILHTCAHSSVEKEELNRVIQYSRKAVWWRNASSQD